MNGAGSEGGNVGGGGGGGAVTGGVFIGAGCNRDSANDWRVGVAISDLCLALGLTI